MGLSQSQFLHALGWATLNSLWQMALLWCVYLTAKSLFNLSASRKYKLSVTAIITGFLWSIFTFVAYYNTGKSFRITILQETFSGQSYLPAFLTTASITYLLLFLVPAYRLFSNWKYTQVLRTAGLQKIDIQYKLFVKRVALQVDITKNVAVYISDLIKSPVTIGFLKPIILLPIASVNSLTIQQVEAVLLHELAHIKRFDYLVNLLLNITHTFLYFNPFFKLFLRVAEEEREHCCDEMVLQFGYDQVSYASALLKLEKASSKTQILAICAAGRKNLLTRIEKIVGINKEPVVNFNRLAGFIAAFICILAVNSLLINTREKVPSLSFNNPVNPFYFFAEINPEPSDRKKPIYIKTPSSKKRKNATNKVRVQDAKQPIYYPTAEESGAPEYIQVALDEIDARLSQPEKNKVKETVEIAKKVLATYEWKEIENSIGDVLTKEEKQVAQQEYLAEIGNIDWNNFEQVLKAEYEKINWENVSRKLNTALSLTQLDSIISVYEDVHKVLETAHLKKDSVDKELNINTHVMPVPDESVKYIDQKMEQLKSSLDTLKSIRNRQTIRL